MSDSRISTKVGIFVLISLSLLAFLILNFSKGLSLIHPTYVIKLRTADVGGIKRQAQVLLGGLKVGSVAELSLAPDGKLVVLRLEIDRRYPLRQDARFSIEQSGFLGDQHVSIYPQSITAPLLPDGAEVRCEEPFNLQDAAKAATGFIQRIDQTAHRLDEAIARVDRVILNESTLSNINLSISNFKTLSQKSVRIADEIELLVQTNRPSIEVSITNMQRFTEEMNRLATNLNGTVQENRGDIGNVIQTLQSSTKSLDELLKGLQAGQGLAGGLLKDTELRETVMQTMLNLKTLSSNLTRYGILYKPRTVKKESEAQSDGTKGSSLLRR